MHRFELLRQRIDPTALTLRHWPLEGGVSADVTALEVEDGKGQTKKFVVRQHGKRDLAANPNVAR